VREADRSKPPKVVNVSRSVFRWWTNFFAAVDKALANPNVTTFTQQIEGSKHVVVDKTKQITKVWFMTIDSGNSNMYQFSMSMDLDEWEAFKKHKESISMFFKSKVQTSYGRESYKEKPELTETWSWRWVDSMENTVQAGEYWYFKEEDAKTAAKVLMSQEVSNGVEADQAKLHIDSHYEVAPDNHLLTHIVFTYLMRKLVSIIATRSCPGCKHQAPPGDSDHEGDNGCTIQWEKKVDMYYAKAADIINYELPADMLRQVKLNLAVSPAWSFFHIECFIKYGGFDKIFNTVKRIKAFADELAFDPLSMLVEYAAEEIDVDKYINVEFFGEKVVEKEKEEEEKSSSRSSTPILVDLL